ncbi:MAG: FkbM family methyltransferase [Anaerolineales bacterium]|nr:FkbM family methyltransferase [Anaerolineales bacterium]
MKVLSNLSDLLAGDVTIRVDEFGGVFSMSGRSSLFQRLSMYKSYEPKLVDTVKHLVDRQRDVIDVGANIGFYTVMFANLIDEERKVLAIEPVNRALQRLHNNISINRVGEKVVVFEGGVSNLPGSLQIKSIIDQEEYSTFGTMVHPATTAQKIIAEHVQISTIDILVQKHSLSPGFIKIDVEGMEPQVVQGMQKVLKDHRPVIVMEWDEFMLKSNGFMPLEIIDWLTGCGYKVVDPLAPSFPPRGNILCLPVERINECLVFL